MAAAPTTTAPSVTHATSSTRLANAKRLMDQAETLETVIAAKDKAKALGLTPKDTEALRVAFTHHSRRVRNLNQE